MQTRSTTDLSLVLLGLIAWVVAVALAVVLPTTEADAVTAAGNKIAVRSPNIAAAGAAGGFAVAGSVCFLGAAFAARESGRHPGPDGPASAPGAAP
jgi:hypothetical protein